MMNETMSFGMAVVFWKAPNRPPQAYRTHLRGLPQKNKKLPRSVPVVVAVPVPVVVVAVAVLVPVVVAVVARDKIGANLKLIQMRKKERWLTRR